MMANPAAKYCTGFMNEAARLSREGGNLLTLVHAIWRDSLHLNVHHEVLYIGVTSDLFTRIPEHIMKVHPNSFTAKYNCNKLVYYETFGRIEDAIAREKQLKKWNRSWKNKLISDFTPGWKNLFIGL